MFLERFFESVAVCIDLLLRALRLKDPIPTATVLAQTIDLWSEWRECVRFERLDVNCVIRGSNRALMSWGPGVCMQ